MRKRLAPAARKAGEPLERSHEVVEKQGTKWLVPPPHPGVLGRALRSELQGPSRGQGKGRATPGSLDLEPALHLRDRMSVGTATPVITGCGTGQALRKPFHRHLPIHVQSAYGVQGVLLTITNVLLAIVITQPTFITCPGGVGGR